MNEYSLLQRIESLERALSESVVRGVIAEIDPEKGQGGMVKVAYGAEHKQITTWLPFKPPRSASAAMWWFPEVGEGVTVISPGDLRMGEVYLGSNHANFPAPSRDPNVFLIQFGDGASVEHNRETHTLTIVNQGDISISTPEKILMSADKGFVLKGNIEHEGNTHTTGNIKADGDISDGTRSMADDRGIYNGHVHDHGSPKTSTPSAAQ